MKINNITIDDDAVVYYFNRYLRIGVGVMFIIIGIYEWSYIPAIFGVPFIIAGIRNRGCHGECYFPPPQKRAKDNN